MPYIGFSPNGGLEFGLTGGIGIGGFNASVSLGYGKESGFTATVNASYMGGYAYAGYNSQAGFITGAGIGFGGFGGPGNFSFNSSAGSAGINYSSKGGFSANAGGLEYSARTGWTANPSVGMSYTMTSGLYGTLDVKDESSQYDSYENPIPYDRESAYKFMVANDLTDLNNEWQNLYADGTLPDKDYSYNNGKVIYKKGKDGILGVTKLRGKDGFLGLWGNQLSDIYLFPNAFRNPVKLYLTIGHELVHVWLNYRGYDYTNSQEATAYRWSADQAKAWNMNILSNKYNSMGNGYSKYPYPYERQVRINRPVYPF
jgi:hypothetical protein